jgi:predicted transcriptional regulator
MKILLSIKPEYSLKILSGEKKFEFRRQRPKENIDIVIIYESYPTKNIVGWFSVKNIHTGSPEEIWDKCNDKGGIDKEKYFSYCNGKNIIHAFEIDNTTPLKNPLNPFELDCNFKPPQNFSYLDETSTFHNIDELNR